MSEKKYSMIFFQFLNIPCIHSHPKYMYCRPRNASSAVLSFFAPCCSPPSRKKNQRSTPAGRFEPMTAAHRGFGSLRNWLHVSLSISLSCTMISLYPAMHKQGNSNRHFYFYMFNLSKCAIELHNLLDDSAKFETLAGTAPQSLGCGARYSDISMFSLGRRKLIIFWLCESQRLALNDHKQTGTNHTSHLNFINSNHLSANPSGIHLVDIYMYI